MSTYTPIASQTLTGNTTKITFSAIPQHYNDLVLVGVITNSTTQIYGAIQFNEDTNSGSTKYSTTSLANWQNNIYSDRQTNTYGIATWEKTVGSSVDAAIIIINVFGYSSTAMHKTVITEQSGMYVNLAGSNTGTWRSYDAVNSISYDSANGNNFGAGTTFTLYGIESGNVSAKASGGNIVTTDGSYWYHAFTSSGVFIPSENLTCDYFVVAGGAGGGYSQGGGGGAGGVLSASSTSLIRDTSYLAVIGAGGTGSTAYQSFGKNGTNSVFSSSTAIGGGGGATGGQNGQNGGSGGGAGNGGSPGTGTSGQGNNGGTAYNSGNYYGGGGGGGAGAVGGNGSSSAGGNGGAGLDTWSTWLSSTGLGVSGYIAGGGGAGTFTGGSYGTGGAGGGGRAGNYSSGEAGQAAIANTGSGGGGSSYGPNFPGSAGSGGNGASGLIIIRYAV